MAIKKLYFKNKLFELRGLPSDAELLSPYEEDSLHEYVEEISSSYATTKSLDKDKKYIQLGETYFEAEEVTLNTLELIGLEETLTEYDLVFDIKENKEEIKEMLKGLAFVAALFIACEIVKSLIIHLAF